MHKIGIMGTPVSSGNRGVLALGASLLGLCLRAVPNADISFLLGHPKADTTRMRPDGIERVLPVVHCRLSFKAKLRDQLAFIVFMAMLYRLVPIGAVRRAIVRSIPWIRAVAEADFVGDVRGGDSFSDIYGMQRYLRGFGMAWSVILIKGSIVQFPQTYGPYQRPIARWIARYILRRSSVVVARDKKSQAVAQAMVKPGTTVRLSPDVAFSLQAIRPATIALTPAPDATISGPVIGLNVNGLMYNGGYTRNNMFGLKMDYAALMPRLIEALLAEHPGELWLVPHTFAAQGHVESDPDASHKVRDLLAPELRARVRIVTAEYDQHEVKGVIGQCDFFVGSRMHACIAALSQGVPCVGVAYSGKFAGVFESVGVEDWVVDGRSADIETALARILALYRTREGARAPLARRADEARGRLVDVFAEIAATAIARR